MMTKWNRACVLPAVLAAAPAMAGDAPRSVSEHSCLEEFMHRLATVYQPAPQLLEASFGDAPGASRPDRPGDRWQIIATDPRSRQEVARATCFIRHPGAHVELLFEPVG